MNDTSRYTYYYITCITSETFTVRLYIPCMRECAHGLFQTMQTKKILSKLIVRLGCWRRRPYRPKTTFLRNISVDFTTTLGQHSILLLIWNLGGGYLFGIKNSRIGLFGTYLHSRNPMRLTHYCSGRSIF